MPVLFPTVIPHCSIACQAKWFVLFQFYWGSLSGLAGDVFWVFLTFCSFFLSFTCLPSLVHFICSRHYKNCLKIHSLRETFLNSIQWRHYTSFMASEQWVICIVVGFWVLTKLFSLNLKLLQHWVYDLLIFMSLTAGSTVPYKYQVLS